MTASPTLRVGLAGAGFLAAARARCWRRVHGVHVELVAVAAGTQEHAQAFAGTHGIGAALAGWEPLVERDDVDLVDVCLPNEAHAPAVVGAARAGKAIVCTKPLAAYVGQDLDRAASDADVAARDRTIMARVVIREARAMVDAAADAGVPLMYGENWVYAPAVQRAAELLAHARGRILELRGEEAHSGSHAAHAGSWRRTGGGALLRLGSHPIGAMLHLKRTEGLARDGKGVGVEAVTAEVADPVAAGGVARDTESWGCATLHFEDGSRGVAFGSDLSLGGMQSRLEIRSSDSRLVCRLSPHDQLTAYAPADGTFGDAYVMEKIDGQAGWTTPLPCEDDSSGQQALCQAFAAAAVAGESPAADGRLGLDVVRVLAAAYVSAAEGRRVRLADLG